MRVVKSFFIEVWKAIKRVVKPPLGGWGCLLSGGLGRRMLPAGTFQQHLVQADDTIFL